MKIIFKPIVKNNSVTVGQKHIVLAGDFCLGMCSFAMSDIMKLRLYLLDRIPYIDLKIT
jgi:hypothetical protein